MTLKPQIDYRHVLGELSVNRKDPCEIVRELISNAYDAGASEMRLWPLLQYKGFAFFDDGEGLSQTVEVKGITPYAAFFSIGKSTKVFGTAIGYKCQGSKLCFASGRFGLFTRCKGEKAWRYRIIENPRHSLELDFDISPEETSTPWIDLGKFIKDPDDRTVRVLAELGREFFEEHFTTGTLIINLDLEVEDYSTHYNPAKCASASRSYLYNYIRHSTKHADVRLLHKSAGFRPDTVLSFLKSPGLNPNVTLRLWCHDDYVTVPPGYPYLPIEDAEQKSPLAVSRLRAGRFSARHAKTFLLDNRQYSLILAVDGNRRAHEGYESLDRRGKRISGIRLTDQRGVFLASQGLKIAPYNELFQAPQLAPQYEALTDADAQSHFILIVDGAFQLVTNRNAPSNEALKTLGSAPFLEQVKSFLQAFQETNSVFRELVQRVNQERAESRRDIQVQALTETRDSISKRERFKVALPPLEAHWFVSPIQGEEHWVGALYTLLSHFVPSDSPYVNYWYRPLTFSARGIDSVCQKPGSQTLDGSKLSAVEYKYSFSHLDFYNHPLNITDVVVSWVLDKLPEADEQLYVYDEYECHGVASPIAGVGTELAYSIADVTSTTGDIYNSEVIVVCLRELIRLTFGVKYTRAPEKPVQKQKANK